MPTMPHPTVPMHSTAQRRPHPAGRWSWHPTHRSSGFKGRPGNTEVALPIAEGVDKALVRHVAIRQTVATMQQQGAAELVNECV